MSEINHKPDCIDQSTCDSMIWSRDQAIAAQARIIAELRQEIAGLRQQLDELISGCGSNSCKVRRPQGQGNNGPCRCVDKLRAIVEEG